MEYLFDTPTEVVSEDVSASIISALESVTAVESTYATVDTMEHLINGGAQSTNTLEQINALVESEDYSDVNQKYVDFASNVALSTVAREGASLYSTYSNEGIKSVMTKILNSVRNAIKKLYRMIRGAIQSMMLNGDKWVQAAINTKTLIENEGKIRKLKKADSSIDAPYILNAFGEPKGDKPIDQVKNSEKMLKNAVSIIETASGTKVETLHTDVKTMFDSVAEDICYDNPSRLPEHKISYSRNLGGLRLVFKETFSNEHTEKTTKGATVTRVNFYGHLSVEGVKTDKFVKSLPPMDSNSIGKLLDEVAKIKFNDNKKIIKSLNGLSNTLDAVLGNLIVDVREGSDKFDDDELRSLKIYVNDASNISAGIGYRTLVMQQKLLKVAFQYVVESLDLYELKDNEIIPKVRKFLTFLGRAKKK